MMAQCAFGVLHHLSIHRRQTDLTVTVKATQDYYLGIDFSSIFIHFLLCSQKIAVTWTVDGRFLDQMTSKQQSKIQQDKWKI